MTNSTKFALVLALFLAAIMAVAGGTKGNSPADAVALPLSAKTGNETPVRATKGDRLYVRPETRKITGVTVDLRDFGWAIR